MATVSFAVIYTVGLRYVGVDEETTRKNDPKRTKAAQEEPTTKKKGNRWVRIPSRAWVQGRANSIAPLFMVVSCLVQLFCLVLKATDSGKLWFKVAVRTNTRTFLPMSQVDNYNHDLCAPYKNRGSRSLPFGDF